MKILILYMNKLRSFTFYILQFTFLISITSCSVSKQIDKVAKEDILSKPELVSAHIGISVYDPAAKKYLYNHDGNKYFIPASNTKIITCYAAMKYLSDSLAGLRYKSSGDSVFLIATGDPTLLHNDFDFQPVFYFLKNFDSTTTLFLDDTNFQEQAWGYGWSWDDYADDYMAERSALPVYGNLVHFEGNANRWSIFPAEIKASVIDSGGKENSYLTKVERGLNENHFTLYFNGTTEKKIDVPFYTNKGETNIELLQKLIKAKIVRKNNSNNFNKEKYTVIHSQPIDSLFRIMMHRSDNFYAEQSLLMVSNEMLGIMNDEKIIDTLLKTDFKEMPQQPRWVDGSGLSRFNLFTPQDFVFVLDKMKNEFNWNRITTIFATGGTGTLGSNAYQDLQNKIFAKTGSLSNNSALSGYLVTNKGKTLIFSVLVGNYVTAPATVRNSIAAFLHSIIDNY